MAPREDHGTATLNWSIVSGDPLGLFAINPADGDITVANSSLLDLEALSAGWTDPAVFDLTVTIHDSEDSGRDETIRVLVTVRDVNESPSLAGQSLTMLEHTRARVVTYGLSPDADQAIRRGEDWGVLHGVPVVLKDAVDVAGLPTRGGSRLVDCRPERSATLARTPAPGDLLPCWSGRL